MCEFYIRMFLVCSAARVEYFPKPVLRRLTRVFAPGVAVTTPLGRTVRPTDVEVRP